MSTKAAAERRHQWMVDLEATWGATGLILEEDGLHSKFGSTYERRGSDLSSGNPSAHRPDNGPMRSPTGSQVHSAALTSSGPSMVAAISFAPTAAVPRLREFPFGSFPETSALVFCLLLAEGQPRFQARRVLNRALLQLKTRGVDDVYAVAKPAEGTGRPTACRYFATDFLAASGFQQVAESKGVLLMHVGLRGLLSLATRLQSAMRHFLSSQPTPSPAAWTRLTG